MKKITYIEMDYHEFDELVKEKYGIETEFVANQEANNDSEYSFNVDGKLSDYQREDWEEKNFQYGNGLLLNKLCEDGHIEPGKYLITVCW